MQGYDADALPKDASETVFVDNLPEDITRRELAHIFRPFAGFKVRCCGWCLKGWAVGLAMAALA